jgi:hypothetical protein
MSFGNTTETDLLEKIFKATSIPWDGNTNLYLSLHTADPGESGNQQTSEATYTSYARVAVSRSGTGWTVSNPTATNAALIQFPTATGGTNTITHVAIGTLSSGTGQILISGALNSSLTVSSGIQPQFSAGALVFTLD